MRSNFWGAKGISNQTFIDPTIAGFRLCRPRVDPRSRWSFRELRCALSTTRSFRMVRRATHEGFTRSSFELVRPCVREFEVKRERIARLIACIAVGLIFPAQISSFFGQNVADLIVDVSEMADGSVAQARLEAQKQASSGALPFRSYAKDDYRSFSGTYTPPELSEDKKGRFVYGLALFSDDGCNVTLKGNVIQQRKGQGQHLPDLGNSFHVLPVTLAPGEPVQISVDYSNIIYVDDPKSPGFPDMDGATLFLYLIPMGIAVDSNRDGTIAFSGEARDTTSRDAPFRFWINDDDDHVDVEENDRVPVLQPDHLDDQIEGRRDLEDFSRLAIYVGSLKEQIADGTYKIGLKWKDVVGELTPAIKVYRMADQTGSDSYLKDDPTAANQVSGVYRSALGDVKDSQEAFILPADIWATLSNDATLHLLFEGSNEGSGELTVTLHKSDSTEIAEAPGVWLDLKNVKKMYLRAKAQPEGIAAPHKSPNDPFSGPTFFQTDPPFEKDGAEEKKALVFVHGWSMTYNAYLNFSETMFKRLVASGL